MLKRGGGCDLPRQVSSLLLEAFKQRLDTLGRAIAMDQALHWAGPRIEGAIKSFSTARARYCTWSLTLPSVNLQSGDREGLFPEGLR